MKFKFPFKPYDIQTNFMKCLYEAIQEKKVCLIESPTGTGKSMSIICAAGRWLSEYKSLQRNDTETYLKELKVRTEVQPKSLNDDSDQKLSTKRPDWLKKQITEIKHQSNTEKIESIKLYLSTLDSLNPGSILNKNHVRQLSTSEISDQIKEHIPKIYYCSRTISQLDQFADEIRKSPFANDFRVTLYASREKLCVNKSVIDAAKKGFTTISQGCNLISTNCKNSSEICPYYSRYTSNLNSIPNDLISTIEWKNWGLKTGMCPYFSNKINLSMAEIILIPYSVLLSSKVVEQLKLNLNNSVVIIDEGHNLLSAVQNVADICINQIRFELVLKFCQQLHRYLNTTSIKKYNSQSISTDISVVESFTFVLKAIISRLNSSPHLEEISPLEFFSSCGLENYNISQISSYMDTNMSRIFDLFDSLYKKQNQVTKKNFAFPLSRYRQSLFDVLNFLDTLTSAKQDDFIIIDSEDVKSKDGLRNCTKNIKILHLNLDNFLKPLIDKCRSIVIVGGTLHPNDDILNLLEKSGIKKSEIIQESYGHIVENKQIFPVVVSRGVMNKEFNFRYENRISDILMLKDLGFSLTELAKCIPDGVVCFFPSYGFLENVISLWKRETIYTNLNQIKPIFYESADGKGEYVYEDYKTNVLSNKGGIFFAIMNGKVSEGINFSDQLARSVIIVGMPFMPIKIPSVYLRLDHICRNTNVQAAMDFYDKSCMTVVNQCVGRAIRHKDDFASMIYLDLRYNRQNHRRNIAKWINSNIVHYDSVTAMMDNLKQFYVENHNDNTNT